MTAQKRHAQSSTVKNARHESQCSVCSHAQLVDINQQFVNWTSPARIATDFGLSRDAVYRHARATGLFAKRRANVRSALEKIIERAGEVEVNAAAVVSAVAAYAKISASGEWVERSQTINLNDLFARMSRAELEQYAQDGELPQWFPARSQQEDKQNES